MVLYIWFARDAVKCRYDHGRKDSCCFRSGNVAITQLEKAQQYGMKVVTLKVILMVGFMIQRH